MKTAAAGLSFVALIWATSACAQQVGIYTGTMQDGSAVAITVGTDPNNSKFEVKVISFDVDLTCKKTMETLNHVGIGLGDGYDIDDSGNFSYSTSNWFDINLVAKMTFRGKRQVSGKGGVNLAAFAPAYDHPKLTDKTQSCDSPMQPFSATFSGTGASENLPPGTARIGNREVTFVPGR